MTAQRRHFRLEVRASAFLPPSTEASCFVRTVFLADEAFFTLPGSQARRDAAPCFWQTRVAIFSHQEHPAV